MKVGLLTNVVLWIVITVLILVILFAWKQKPFYDKIEDPQPLSAIPPAVPGADEQIADYWYGGQYIPGYSLPAFKTPSASL